MGADLILLGRVLGAGRADGHAEAVAVVDGRIAAVGPQAQVLALRDTHTEILGDRSTALVPGFVDAHLHLVALARRAAEIDCSAESVRSIPELLALIRAAARARPSASWIRAFGYDEAFLEERRAPTVAELDAAAPDHPVRLLHRTGHAVVLNGAAWRMLGSPPQEVVYEPGDLLHGKIPGPGAQEMSRLVAATSERLLAAGITALCDPTPGMDAGDVAALRSWVEDGTIRQRVVVFAEPERVKIVIDEASDAAEIIERVAVADRAGAQIALHAVEGGPLVIAIEALRQLGRARVRTRRHRIEHAALCPPPLCEAIRECGATIVTHPIFLARFGEKYRSELTAEEQEWLYPLRSFRDAGVPLALGSDAPIAPPVPLANVQAAVLRRSEEGAMLGAKQAITVAEALELATHGGAVAARLESLVGPLDAGRPADLVLLARHPSEVAPNEIASIAVRATITGGRVAWRA